MWQKIISLSKDYVREIEYVDDKVRQLPKAQCEAYASRDRVFFIVGAKEKDKEEVSRQTLRIIAEVVLIYFKFERLTKAVGGRKMTSALATLLSALIRYDAEREYEYIVATLKESDTCAIDGLMNFRLTELSEGWEEVCDMTAGLLETGCRDSDIYSVAQYMMPDAADNSLFVADSSDPLITNITKGGVVDVPRLFADKVFDIIGAVIIAGAGEVIVEGNKVDKVLVDALKNVVKIKVL